MTPFTFDDQYQRDRLVIGIEDQGLDWAEEDEIIFVDLETQAECDQIIMSRDNHCRYDRYYN